MDIALDRALQVLISIVWDYMFPTTAGDPCTCKYAWCCVILRRVPRPALRTHEWCVLELTFSRRWYYSSTSTRLSLHKWAFIFGPYKHYQILAMAEPYDRGLCLLSLGEFLWRAHYPALYPYLVWLGLDQRRRRGYSRHIRVNYFTRNNASDTAYWEIIRAPTSPQGKSSLSFPRFYHPDQAVLLTITSISTSSAAFQLAGEYLNQAFCIDCGADFDLFSLIALMLGRLKMSTEEAIEAYNELSEFVFKEKKN